MTLYLTPYRNINRRRLMQRMINEVMSAQPTLFFPIDVKAEDDAYVISAVLPGARGEDLDIQVLNESVTISGEIQLERDGEAEYLLAERSGGRFSRTLTLPAALDPDGAQASLENGILTLRVPKTESAKPRTIKVSTSNN